MPGSTPSPMRLNERWLFIGTWAAAALYGLSLLDLGWFPVDAGMLGQAAERVLGGELPHRDFADVYTGGLAFLDALAFRVLGVGVMSMRWVVFAVYVAWVPAVWYLARRVTNPVPAALATLLAASWTLPIYSEGMPSWYNLFLATFGAAALLRYAEKPGVHWLFLAGLAGGLSVLVKIVGVYYLAAGALFLVCLEALQSREAGDRSADGGYRVVMLASTAFVAAAVLWLVGRGMGVRHLFLYGAPPLAALGAVGWTVWRPSGRPGGDRVRSLIRTLAPFVLGAVAPVVVFAWPYLTSGALADLWTGVFASPQERLQSVRMIGPAGQWYYAGLAFLPVLWLAEPAGSPRLARRAITLVGGIALVAAVALSHRDPTYVLVFRGLLWSGPIVCLAAAVVAARAGSRTAPAPLLLLVTSGWISLVQVPFAAPVYFFYAAPLLVLAGVAAVGRGDRIRLLRLQGLLLTLLVFTVLRLNEGFSPDLGFRYRDDPMPERLVMSRAMGIRVSADDKRDYEGVVELVQAVNPGSWLYAGPDAPEVYFLTGLSNPTPTLYEVLDDPAGHDARVLDAVDTRGVRVIVVRLDPLFSPPLGGDLLAELERRYPRSRQVGRFIVAWGR